MDELSLLALCGGFQAEAEDGELGVVETPLFPPDGSVPDFLVVRVRDHLRSRRPVVPAALVAAVDPALRVVRLRGSRDELSRLPEHLPLAI